MKEYKGLKIPEIETIATQTEHCEYALSTGACDGIACEQCLYNNKEKFEEWYVSTQPNRDA